MQARLNAALAGIRDRLLADMDISDFQEEREVEEQEPSVIDEVDEDLAEELELLAYDDDELPATPLEDLEEAELSEVGGHFNAFLEGMMKAAMDAHSVSYAEAFDALEEAAVMLESGGCMPPIPAEGDRDGMAVWMSRAALCDMADVVKDCAKPKGE